MRSSDPRHADRPARVLVTGAGGPAAVSFMEAVDDGETEVWAVDIDPHAAGLYLVDAAHRGLVPRGDSPDLVPVLLDLCERLGIDVLVPTVDTELLPVVEASDAFAAVGTRILANSPAALATCLDKWALYEACVGAVPVPETHVVSTSLDASSLPWPRIIKPRAGSGSRGVELLSGPSELDRFPRDGSLILQELLPGTELSLDVLARADGGVVAVVPRTRLKVDSGIAVAGCTVADPALDELGRGVAAQVGLTSVANVQVKQHADGGYRLLEVNPRLPGSMPLTVAAGVDMPSLALADVLGHPVPERVEFQELAMVRSWKQTFLPVDEYVATGAVPVPSGVGS
jgi:carbamoyl-phosphate synthase large subunit